MQGIVCRTHRPPLYLHHHPPSLHPIIQQDAVSLWGRRLSFFIFCPLSILHFPWFSAHERSQRSNEAGGGAQGVFRVVVHCVLLLPVDSVGPWALPVEEAKGRHYRTYNLRPPGSSMLFLIKTMPGRKKKKISKAFAIKISCNCKYLDICKRMFHACFCVSSINSTVLKLHHGSWLLSPVHIQGSVSFTEDAKLTVIPNIQVYTDKYFLTAVFNNNVIFYFLL